MAGPGQALVSPVCTSGCVPRGAGNEVHLFAWGVPRPSSQPLNGPVSLPGAQTREPSLGPTCSVPWQPRVRAQDRNSVSSGWDSTPCDKQLSEDQSSPSCGVENHEGQGRETSLGSRDSRSQHKLARAWPRIALKEAAGNLRAYL